MSDQKQDKVLTKRDLIRTSIRHYIGVSTYNYDTGIATAIVWELFPALRKIYKNDDDLVESLDNHFTYYNTHPWASAVITGATLAMEEKDGLKAKKAVQGLKAGLMGPLAGIGDTLIWVMLPTIFGAIAGSMGKQGNPAGMWIFTAVYLALFALRSYLYVFGYNSGVKLITSLGSKLSAFTSAISVLGITVIGGIISSTITFKVAWRFSSGGVSLSMQSILDQLCPSLLPVALVALLYWLLKRGHKMTTLILVVIVLAMAGAAIGLFKA